MPKSPRQRRATTPDPTLHQRREAIEQLFCHGQNDAAFMERFFCCVRASECGRLCERLIKAPGSAEAHCVDLDARTKILLYQALADPRFVCPKGRF
jgi:hypothetical protein